MDTATRTLAARIALIACLTVATLVLGSQAQSAAPRLLVISGATAVEERAVDWALHRYREAGLGNLPSLEVYLHRDHAACNGGLGLYYAGRIDLCTEDSSEPYQRKFALHEIAHAWTEANVDDEVLDRFMQVRGVTSWNDRSFPWKERGTEQAAEIITWGLGEGQIAPQLPGMVSSTTLIDMFELLTGRAPITPAAP